ncbi:MAG: hypothetical protein ACOYJB_05825 [Christensenellaceae bacterium]
MQQERTLKQKWFNRPYWLWFLLAFSVFYIALLAVTGSIALEDQLYFLLCQVVFVFVPGTALVLLVRPRLSAVAFGIASYMAGVAINIALYYIVYALSLEEYLLVFMAAVAALSLIYIFRKKERLRQIKPAGKDMWVFLLLVACALTLVFFTTVSKNTLPTDAAPYKNYYQDMLWNTGNTVSLANGFPAADFHIQGFSFVYHYFTHVFLAVFYNITGISAFVLNFKLLAVLQVILFVGAAYLLTTLFTKRLWLRAAVTVLILLTNEVVLSHMLLHAYATAFSLAFALLAAYFFLRYLKNIQSAKPLDADYILFMVMLVVACGAKGLFAAVVLAGAGFSMLYMLTKKQNTRVILLHGILAVAISGALLVSLTLGVNTVNGLQVAFGSPLYMDPPAYYTAALQTLTPALSQAAVKLLMYPVFLAVSYIILFAGLIWLFVVLIKYRREDMRKEWFLFWAMLFGLVCASVFYQPGLSNVLFITAALPFSVLAVVACAQREYATGQTYQKLTAALAASVILAMGLYPVPKTVSTVQSVLALQEAPASVVGRDDIISLGEYEGMLWLRENTQKDAVFAADRQYFTHIEDIQYARYYYYTAFSERQCYLEGFNYVSTHEPNFLEKIDGRLQTLERAYGNDEIALAELKKNGVGYLVSSTVKHGEFMLDKRFGELVFENADIRIFALL